MAVVDHLRDLSVALIARDLNVRVDARRGTVTACNPRVLGSDDPRGRIDGPGLTQVVALAVHDDASLHWYWHWAAGTGRERYEYLGPGNDVRGAADAIAAVLSLGPVGR